MDATTPLTYEKAPLLDPFSPPRTYSGNWNLSELMNPANPNGSPEAAAEAGETPDLPEAADAPEVETRLAACSPHYDPFPEPFFFSV